MRRLSVSTFVALLAALALAPVVEPQAQPYTVLSRDGSRPLPVLSINGHEMVSLDDLATLFDVQVREDTLAGGLTVSTKSQTIVLTPGQGLASVGGRMISLPAPPTREGQSWYVPIEFVPGALGRALGVRLELRRPSRLILFGDVRVPRVAVRVEPQGELARVTLDVSPATPHAVTQEGNRLLVRFEAQAIDPVVAPSPAPELVQAVRVAENAVGIAIDLGPRFASFRTADQPGQGRTVIDVMAAPTAAEASPTPAPTAPSAPSAPPPPPLDLTPPGLLRTIVIDPGHGGDDHGARGSQGTLEKDVTLSVARRLKAAIEARLGSRVILTRDADRTVGLDERAAVANNNKADLFLSLHANASVRPAVAGAEVFFLSLADYGDQAQLVAQGNPEPVPALGGTRNIEVILWEMAQARHIEASTVLAQIMEGALRARVPMSPRAIQQAPFRVLVGANMPAVLVEMGFITNPEQEKQLASESFQAGLTQALLDGIVRFRDNRGESQAPRVAAESHGAAGVAMDAVR